MHDLADRADLLARFLQQARDAVEDGAAGIVGRGQALAGQHAAARAIDQHQVGEGSADIDADAKGLHGHSFAP